MTDFTYTVPLPVPGNDPSVDQPNMTINNASNSGIWDVDHIGFNAGNGGTHLQTTFANNPDYINTPTAPTANGAILYTNAGVASTAANLSFVNANATFLVSALRSFGTFTTGASPTVQNNYNVTSVTSSVGVTTTVYTITLASGCTTGNNVTVLAFSTATNTAGGGLASSFASGVLTISATNNVATAINFAVLQV